MSAVSLSISVALCAAAVGAAFDPYVPGPHQVKHTWISGLLQPDLPVSVGVSAPETAGQFPALVFISGLQDEIPALVYDKFLARMASHGLVVATAWSLTELPDPVKRAAQLEPVMAWLRAELPGYLRQHHFPGISVDFNRTTMLAHSAGAHVAVSYLERTCDPLVQGLVLMSPVDGVDPFSIIKEFCITPGQKVNFTVPTLLLTAGLDATSGIPLMPPCAPTELSNDRFYDAMPAPRWQLNATQFGHADVLEPFFWEVVRLTHFCAVCAADDCAEREAYRAYTAGQIVSFAFAVTDPANHCDQLQYLEDFATTPVHTVGRSDRPEDVCSGFMKGCVRP